MRESSRGWCLPAGLHLAVKLPFMDSLVMRSRSAVCVCCPASGEVGVMVPGEEEEAALAAIWARLSSKFYKTKASKIAMSKQQHPSCCSSHRTCLDL